VAVRMMENFLSDKRNAILKRWTDLIFDAYPGDSADFFKSEKDKFRNPVGTTILQETSCLYDQLLGDMELNTVKASLDKIIRIRSVQEFSASQAIGFVLLLKNAVESELSGDNNVSEIQNQIREFYFKIDRLVLYAFDIYMDCREKINRIRIDEVKKRNVGFAGRIVDNNKSN
jgi:hypothetical protein